MTIMERLKAHYVGQTIIAGLHPTHNGKIIRDVVLGKYEPVFYFVLINEEGKKEFVAVLPHRDITTHDK